MVQTLEYYYLVSWILILVIWMKEGLHQTSDDIYVKINWDRLILSLLLGAVYPVTYYIFEVFKWKK